MKGRPSSGDGGCSRKEYAEGGGLFYPLQISKDSMTPSIGGDVETMTPHSRGGVEYMTPSHLLVAP